MIDNILVFERNRKVGKHSATDIIKFERFTDGIVSVEASNSLEGFHGGSVIINLDFDEVKKLAEFLGGLIGMVST